MFGKEEIKDERGNSLSQFIFENFSPFLNVFIFYSFDPFISQVHTLIFMNYIPTEFFYNLPKLTNFWKDKLIFIHLDGKVELQTVGNVMNWVKGSKGIIDILLLVSLSILLVRISVIF